MSDDGVRLVRPGDGRREPGPGEVTDRFLVDGSDTGERFALVEHLFAPGALAAPMHRHHREDEYTYVLTGTIGAVLDGREVVAEAGDLLFKPRMQWHTFWNAGDEPATVLELISPAGLEQFFRWLDGLAEFPPPEVLAREVLPYECDIDPVGTEEVMRRLGLAP